MAHRHTSDGTTISVVITEERAPVAVQPVHQGAGGGGEQVLPAVPMEASSAYWVAV